MIRVLVICCLTLVAAACGRAAAPAPLRDAEPSRARAALATLSVENRSEERIQVLYRFANRTAPDVGIGFVAAGATVELAPVPAGEPLLLIARTSAGGELSSGPRTFVIDGSWTWQIERGSRFEVPPRSGL